MVIRPIADDSDWVDDSFGDDSSDDCCVTLSRDHVEWLARWLLAVRRQQTLVLVVEEGRRAIRRWRYVGDQRIR